MADELATIARMENTIHNYQYAEPSVLPSMLYIAGDPITSKYQECVKTAFFKQQLFDYYIQKFEWNPTTLHDIDWDSFDRALTKLSHSDRQRIQKYNINRLHTNVRDKYFHQHRSDLCPSCQSQSETNYHILQCTAESRASVTSEWLRDLLDHLNNDNTPTSIKKAIMIGLTSWLHNKDASQDIHDIPDISEEVQQAYIHQSTIGWGQLTRGKLSKSWVILMERHIASQKQQTQARRSKHKLQFSATQWATNLILTIWKGVLNAWDSRNADCHGHDKQTMNTKEKSKLLQEAEYLKQQYGQSLRDDDAHWFDTPHHILEEYTVMGLKAWVRNARTISRLHHQEQKTRMKTIPNCEPAQSGSPLICSRDEETVNSNVSAEEEPSGECK